MSKPAKQSILLLGAGELGIAIIDALTTHPFYSASTTPITLLLRPSTISSPSPSKLTQLNHFKSLSISLLAADTDTASLADLTSLFRPFHTIIHASGMLSPTGVQTKITDAALAAGIQLYLPWQFGLDYDAIGPDAGMGLFSEQYAIREKLRAQSTTKWVIVSNGIFMSFLFGEMWGVVQRVDEGKRIKVTALNSWDDDWITATTAEDIGRCVAEVVVNGEEDWGGVVYIAGETLRYREFAELVEEVSGKEVVREVWPLQELEEKARANPEEKLPKYHVVFAGGKGVTWPKEETWNAKKGWQMEGIRSWMEKNFK